MQNVKAAAPGGGRLRRRMLVKGLVQGVGFLPFTYRLAAELGLSGWVRNVNPGVLILVEGEPRTLDTFERRLTSELPAVARIDGLQADDRPARGPLGSFRVRRSRAWSEPAVPVAPDLATCPECAREIADPRDRRYRYPFTSCNVCGPRYTVVTQLPYERTGTTLSPFQPCARCQSECDDPQSRRFHSQTISCPECGPAFWIEPSPPPSPAHDVVAEVAELLLGGSIVAIKGLGGFHLTCLADDEQAVSVLRRRKRREGKPLPVMVADLDAAERLVHLTPTGRALLLDRAAPILLARKRVTSALAPSVAPDSPDCGLMLPHTPFHHLLLADVRRPLVMTSANLGGDAIVSCNEEARRRLSGLADYLVLHDRHIHVACDDSVTRLEAEGPVPVRRSRGYAPSPIVLKRDLPPILALGGLAKATVAVTCGRNVFVSQHLGDLRTGSAAEAFHHTVEHLLRLWDLRPELVAHDLDPSSLGSMVAHQFGGRAIGVQHHHAHMASVMAEHGVVEPVLGVCLDGSGFRSDDESWGGEFLLGDAVGFQRVASVPRFRLPGGEAGARYAWRTAVGLLWDLLGPEAAREWTGRVRSSQAERDAVLSMLESGVACTGTTSLGRMLDGFAAIVGLCDHSPVQVQAALRLERAAGAPRAIDTPSLPDPRQGGTEVVRAVLRRLLSDGRDPANAAALAAWTQAAISRWVALTATELAACHGIGQIVASGGCLFNPWLRSALRDAARAQRLTLLLNRFVPPGDGGLTLGQVYVASAVAEGTRR